MNNMIRQNSKKYLKLLLVLLAIHSYAVGLGLIFLPKDLFTLFGYNSINEVFFVYQGGVFHLVMATGYLIAANVKSGLDNFLKFIIIVKFIATIFLVLYFIFASTVLVVLLSGIVDFIMGLAVLYFYLIINNNN